MRGSEFLKNVVFRYAQLPEEYKADAIKRMEQNRKAKAVYNFICNATSRFPAIVSQV